MTGWSDPDSGAERDALRRFVDDLEDPALLRRVAEVAPPALLRMAGEASERLRDIEGSTMPPEALVAFAARFAVGLPISPCCLVARIGVEPSDPPAPCPLHTAWN